MIAKNASWDPIWEDIFTNNDWGKYPSESLIQFIARNFYKLNRSEIRILEIGCGPGANIWYLSKEGFNAYGIDGSNTAIDKASKRLISENLTANLMVGDIINLPFEDDFFDAVLDVECLSCNNRGNADLILNEVKRVLKKEGKFYSRTFTDKMFIGNIFNKLAPGEYTNIKEGPMANKGFVRLTSEEDVMEMYSKHFEVVSLDTLDYSQFNKNNVVSEFVIISKK